MRGQLFVFRTEYDKEVYPFLLQPVVSVWRIVEDCNACMIYANRSWWWIGLNFDWAKEAALIGDAQVKTESNAKPDDVICRVIPIEKIEDDPIIQEAMDHHKVFTLEELADSYSIDCLIRTGEGHEKLLDSLYDHQYTSVSINGLGRHLALAVQDQLQKGKVTINFSDEENWSVVNTHDGYVSINHENRTRRLRIEEFYPEICAKVSKMVVECDVDHLGCCFCIEIIGTDKSMRFGKQKYES